MRPEESNYMFGYLKRFKQIIISVLTVMMAFVLLLATIELGWIIVKDVVTPPCFCWRSMSCWKYSGCSCWLSSGSNSWRPS